MLVDNIGLVFLHYLHIIRELLVVIHPKTSHDRMCIKSNAVVFVCDAMLVVSDVSFLILVLFFQGLCAPAETTSCYEFIRKGRRT